MKKVLVIVLLLISFSMISCVDKSNSKINNNTSSEEKDQGSGDNNSGNENDKDSDENYRFINPISDEQKAIDKNAKEIFEMSSNKNTKRNTIKRNVKRKYLKAKSFEDDSYTLSYVENWKDHIQNEDGSDGYSYDAIKENISIYAYSFAVLENLIQTDRAFLNYNGLSFYSDDLGDSCLMILKDKEFEDIRFIKSYYINCVIGTDENGRQFFVSYDFEHGFFTYLTNEFMVKFYRNFPYEIWQEEIVETLVLCESFTINHISSKPFKLIQKLFKENDLTVEPYDASNPNHVLLKEDSNDYTSINNLKDMYMTVFFDGEVLHLEEPSFNIQNDVLTEIYYGYPIVLTIPDNVKEISLNYPTYGFSVVFPESLEVVYNYMFLGYKYFFFKSENKDENIEKNILEYIPDAKFYYKDSWEEYNGIPLPVRKINMDHEHLLNPYECDNDSHFQICVICGQKENIGEHKFMLINEIESTCFEEGTIEYQCEVCSFVKYDKVEKKEHDVIELEHIEPSCEKDGYIKYHCNDCDLDYTKVIEKTGHIYKLINEVEPTCSQTGYKEYQCENCDAITKTTSEILSSHDIYTGEDEFGHWTTCNEYYHWKECKNCDVIINMEPHDICKINNEYFCSMCGYKLTVYEEDYLLYVLYSHDDEKNDEYIVKYKYNFDNPLSEEITEISINTLIKGDIDYEGYVISIDRSIFIIPNLNTIRIFGSSIRSFDIDYLELCEQLHDIFALDMKLEAWQKMLQNSGSFSGLKINTFVLHCSDYTAVVSFNEETNEVVFSDITPVE